MNTSQEYTARQHEHENVVRELRSLDSVKNYPSTTKRSNPGCIDFELGHIQTVARTMPIIAVSPQCYNGMSNPIASSLTSFDTLLSSHSFTRSRDWPRTRSSASQEQDCEDEAIALRKSGVAVCYSGYFWATGRSRARWPSPFPMDVIGANNSVAVPECTSSYR